MRPSDVVALLSDANFRDAALNKIRSQLHSFNDLDADDDVRCFKTLEELKWAYIAPLFNEALFSESWQARLAAAEALGMLLLFEPTAQVFSEVNAMDADSFSLKVVGSDSDSEALLANGRSFRLADRQGDDFEAFLGPWTQDFEATRRQMGEHLERLVRLEPFSVRRSSEERGIVAEGGLGEFGRLAQERLRRAFGVQSASGSSTNCRLVLSSKEQECCILPLLLYLMYHPKWEVRHGALAALQHVLLGIRRVAKDSPSDMMLTSARVLVRHVVLRALLLLHIEAFADLACNPAVLPVSFTCGQLLALTLPMLAMDPLRDGEDEAVRAMSKVIYIAKTRHSWLLRLGAMMAMRFMIFEETLQGTFGVCGHELAPLCASGIESGHTDLVLLSCDLALAMFSPATDANTVLRRALPLDSSQILRNAILCLKAITDSVLDSVENDASIEVDPEAEVPIHRLLKLCCVILQNDIEANSCNRLSGAAEVLKIASKLIVYSTCAACREEESAIAKRTNAAEEPSEYTGVEWNQATQHADSLPGAIPVSLEVLLTVGSPNWKADLEPFLTTGWTELLVHSLLVLVCLPSRKRVHVPCAQFYASKLLQDWCKVGVVARRSVAGAFPGLLGVQSKFKSNDKVRLKAETDQKTSMGPERTVVADTDTVHARLKKSNKSVRKRRGDDRGLAALAALRKRVQEAGDTESCDEGLDEAAEGPVDLPLDHGDNDGFIELNPSADPEYSQSISFGQKSLHETPCDRVAKKPRMDSERPQRNRRQALLALLAILKKNSFVAASCRLETYLCVGSILAALVQPNDAYGKRVCQAFAAPFKKGSAKETKIPIDYRLLRHRAVFLSWLAALAVQSLEKSVQSVQEVSQLPTSAFQVLWASSGLDWQDGCDGGMVSSDCDERLLTMFSEAPRVHLDGNDSDAATFRLRMIVLQSFMVLQVTSETGPRIPKPLTAIVKPCLAALGVSVAPQRAVLCSDIALLASHCLGDLCSRINKRYLASRDGSERTRLSEVFQRVLHRLCAVPFQELSSASGSCCTFEAEISLVGLDKLVNEVRIDDQFDLYLRGPLCIRSNGVRWTERPVSRRRTLAAHEWAIYRIFLERLELFENHTKDCVQGAPSQDQEAEQPAKLSLLLTLFPILSSPVQQALASRHLVPVLSRYLRIVDPRISKMSAAFIIEALKGVTKVPSQVAKFCAAFEEAIDAMDSRRPAELLCSQVVKALLAPSERSSHSFFLLALTPVVLRGRGKSSSSTLAETFQHIVNNAPFLLDITEEPKDMGTCGTLFEDGKRTLMGLTKGFKGEELHGFAKTVPTSLNGVLTPSTELRPYQCCGVAWLHFLWRFDLGGFLCDEMGLGKTLQSLSATMLHWKYLHSRLAQTRATALPSLVCLILCPTSLTHHWETEVMNYCRATKLPGRMGDNTERPVKNVKVLVYKSSRTPISLADAMTPILKEEEDVPAGPWAGSPLFLIVSYSKLRSDSASVANALSQLQCSKQKASLLDFLILDEAHLLAKPTTKTYAAVSSIAKLASYRVALSGTPIQNRLGELWSVFNLLLPGYLGGYEPFKRQYEAPLSEYRRVSCRVQQCLGAALAPDSEAASAFGYGMHALQSLRKKLRLFILRRLKRDVLTDLPEKVCVDLPCEASPEQQQLLDNLSNGSQVDSPESRNLSWVQRFRRLSFHPELDSGHDCDYKDLDWRMSGKLRALDVLLRNLQLCSEQFVWPEQTLEIADPGPPIIPDRKVVMFAQHHATLTLTEAFLQKRFPHLTVERLDGKTAAERRERIAEKFRAGAPASVEGAADILLSSTRAGGVGLNLTAVDTVVMLEHDWNPVVDLQAMDRVHRIGQRSSVHIYRLIIVDSVEQRIMGIQNFKKRLAELVVPAADNLDTERTESVDAGSVNVSVGASDRTRPSHERTMQQHSGGDVLRMANRMGLGLHNQEQTEMWSAEDLNKAPRLDYSVEEYQALSVENYLRMKQS